MHVFFTSAELGSIGCDEEGLEAPFLGMLDVLVLCDFSVMVHVELKKEGLVGGRCVHDIIKGARGQSRNLSYVDEAWGGMSQKDTGFPNIENPCA